MNGAALAVVAPHARFPLCHADHATCICILLKLQQRL